MIPNTQKPEVDINTALAKAINYKILYIAFKLQSQKGDIRVPLQYGENLDCSDLN